jgi:hypothetical protein
MRYVALSILAASALSAEGFGPSLTVLVDFEQTPSVESFTEMKREVTHLLGRTGYRLDLQMRAHVADGAEFEDLAMVRFKGSCRMSAFPFTTFIDERGPLAWSHTVEGDILPFSEVACDRIRRAVDSAIWGGQRGQREKLLGRALGRVLAHELFHIVARNPHHTKSGVFKESLSGAQLIADRLEFSKDDARRMHREWRAAVRSTAAIQVIR